MCGECAELMASSVPGECTELMGSPVQRSNTYGGFVEDSYFHQDIHKLQYLDQQMLYYPASSGAIQTGGKEVRENIVKRDVLPSQVSEAEANGRVDAHHARGELVNPVIWVPRNAWVHHGEEGEALSSSQNDLANGYATAILHSPDKKFNTTEPRSVLDLAISPRQSTPSAVSSYDFEPSPSTILLDVHDEFLSDFHRIRRDPSSHLPRERGDSSRWEASANSSDCLPQTSHFWMDSLAGDLGNIGNPAQACVPGLDTEGGEARPDTPSTTPSECHKSPNSDQEQSEEEEISGAAEDSPSSQHVQSGSFRETRNEAPNREVGLELVNLLLACAEAVSTDSLSLVNPLFAQLGELASPEGTSMQRVAAYFTEGLATRCSRLWPHIYRPLPCNLDLSEEDNLCAFHILNHVCPYIKFAHFTANEIILQAFEGRDRVHVIDFDIKQGLQWPALFQSLAARPGGPPSHVRVTGIGDCKEDVQDTGDRLAEFADALGLPFEFHVVIDKLEDVRLWMLHVKEKEAVAVNCILQLHRALDDSGNGIKDLLGLIASTKPKVVAVVEQEASHNGPFFEGRYPRFLESLQYYAAIFDSLDFNMPADSPARMKVEQMFAREIRNILACEGLERTERHEIIETWRLHLEAGGFSSVPLTKRAKTQARLLLEMFACKSYTITEDHGGALTIGWRSRPLFTASAWSPK